MLSTQIYAFRGSLLTHTIPGFSRAGLEQRLHSRALEISLRRKSCTAETNTPSPLYFFKLKSFLPNCAPDFFLFSSSFPARFPGSLQSLCCCWCHTQPLLLSPSPAAPRCRHTAARGGSRTIPRGSAEGTRGRLAARGTGVKSQWFVN